MLGISLLCQADTRAQAGKPGAWRRLPVLVEVSEHGRRNTTSREALGMPWLVLSALDQMLQTRAHRCGCRGVHAPDAVAMVTQPRGATACSCRLLQPSRLCCCTRNARGCQP